MPGWRITTFLALLMVMLIFLQYLFWFQSGGMRDFLELKNKLAAQEQLNHQLKATNEALLIEIKGLQNNADTKEGRARHELGMIKKDETYYQIVK